MGNQTSRSSQLNDILNKTATEIMVTVSSNASGTYSGNQNISISGNTGNVNGVRIEQVGSIDLSVTQNAQVNANLQEKLTTGLTNAVVQKRSDFPQINASSTTSDIKNIIKNEVSAKFSVDAIASLQIEIENNQNIDINNNVGSVSDIAIKQTATGVGRLINSLSSDIISQITTETETENSSDQKTTFWGADLVESFGTMWGNIFGGMFGAISPLFIVAICAGGLFMLYFTYSFFSHGGTSQQVMGMMNPPTDMVGQYGPPQQQQYGPPQQQQYGPPQQQYGPPQQQYGPPQPQYGPPQQQYGRQPQYGPPQQYQPPPPLQYAQ